MPSGYEKSPDYGGPEPGRGWLWALAVFLKLSCCLRWNIFGGEF